MWIVTTIGFFSIVEKPWDRKDGTLTVRARRREDLEALDQYAGWQLAPTEIVEDALADYHYRLRAPRAEVTQAIGALVAGITYDNFKAQIHESDRHDAYLQAWAAFQRLQPKRRVIDRRQQELFGRSGQCDLWWRGSPKPPRRPRQRPRRRRKAGRS